MIVRNSRFFPIAAIAAIIVFLSSSGPAAAKAVEEGMNVSDVTFTTPPSQEARCYLGLETESSFTLTDIPAKLVLVEVFHVLCQYCQKQAPVMNRVFQFIQQDPELARNIKVFSIGIQSEQRSLDAFKETFRVKFPILPDEKIETFTALGEPPIPFLLLVDEKGNVLLTHEGYLKDGDDFFRKIKDFYSQTTAE